MHRLFFPSCAKKTNRVTRRHSDRPDKTLLLGRQPSHGARNIFLLCIIRVFSRAVLEEERGDSYVRANKVASDAKQQLLLKRDPLGRNIVGRNCKI